MGILIQEAEVDPASNTNFISNKADFFALVIIVFRSD